jgi:hypothetical protein
MLIGIHSCITVETQLLNLSIEEHYYSLTNTVFWDDFTAVSIIETA